MGLIIRIDFELQAAVIPIFNGVMKIQVCGNKQYIYQNKVLTIVNEVFFYFFCLKAVLLVIQK